ncbi:MAG: nodulation protein NfeD [Helicobacteraceae bacterium]|jgi:membrane protein implicated in regulation of membrane protease activity|nr:nodulation protein NfeD [Helicobacteraceae bacterium]
MAVGAWVLIAGAILIALELATGGFFLLWYGIGLMISGAAGWALGFDEAAWQIAIGLAIGLALMVVFRKRLVRRRKNEPKDEFLLEEGEGTIKSETLVEFRGTLWQYDAPNGAEFAAGERVIVRPAASGLRVTIAKKARA